MLLDCIQRIVNNVLNDRELTDYTTGTVTSVSPLEITLSGTMLPIKRAVIKLTQAVSDYQVDITIDGTRQTATIHNGLRVGDKVILLRVLNGQNFIVLSKVVP
jgi:hypothetical protein